MSSTEVKWWQTIQKPNLGWYRQKHLIPVFELTIPERDPFFVYADPIVSVGGVEVTSLHTEIEYELSFRYADIPIANLREGKFALGAVEVQISFVGFMDDKNLQDKAWSQWL